MAADYNQVDPPLPENGEIESTTKLVLELYANEISEHASSVLSIYGVSGFDTEMYKDLCYQAARCLNDAAAILRANNKMGPIKMVMKAAPHPHTVLDLSQIGKVAKSVFLNAVIPAAFGLGTMIAARYLGF